MKKYFSLVMFTHTIFALPFAVVGFFLAVTTTEFSFSWKLFLLMLGCMVTARTAAMAFNRYLDRRIDAANPRTQNREIPAGALSANGVLFFTLLNAALFIACTYFINPLCFALSPVALAVVLGYSYTKRFTPLCHLILGAGLALAPIGSYLTITGEFDLIPLLFSFAVLTWVSGFDIIYALQDEAFDREQGLRSIPVWLGARGALRFSELLHLFSASLVIAAGFLLQGGIFYWLGVASFAGLLIYQHRLVKHDDLSKVNRAFFTTNGIASCVFALFFLVDLFLK